MSLGVSAAPHWVPHCATCLVPMGVNSLRDVPLSVDPPTEPPVPFEVATRLNLSVDAAVLGPGRLVDAALQGAALAVHRGRSLAGQIHRGQLPGGLLPGWIHRGGLGEAHGHPAPGRIN